MMNAGCVLFGILAITGVTAESTQGNDYIDYDGDVQGRSKESTQGNDYIDYDGDIQGRSKETKPNLEYLDYDRHQDRIIAGYPVEIDEFPSTVFVSTRIDDNQQKSCSGSIVSKRWIVTAGHCVYGASPSNITITAGMTTLDRGGKEYRVDKTRIHDDYSETDGARDYDIALVRETFNYNGRQLTKVVTRVQHDQNGSPNNFTNEELADMHLMYGLSEGNGREALRLYNERFPVHRAPNHRYFAQLHQNLKDTGSFMIEGEFDLDGKSIAIANLPAEGNEVLAGDKLIMLGWGYSLIELSFPTNKLQKAYVQVLDEFNCSQVLPNYVHEYMFCTSSMVNEIHQGGLSGDSGGPLYDGDTLVGIHVSGYISSNKVYPDKNMRISTFKKWIQDTATI